MTEHIHAWEPLVDRTEYYIPGGPGYRACNFRICDCGEVGFLVEEEF